MTYRELVFICKDLLKIMSDDAVFEDEHVIFLAGRFRNMLLKKYYDTPKKTIPESSYQTVSLDLIPSTDNKICDEESYLVSVQEVPYISSISNINIYPVNYFLGDIEFISKERFKYVGKNKYLRNIIFATIDPTNHLYIKSANKNLLFLEKVNISAVFEDTSKVLEITSNDGTDKLDQRFPLEDALVPELIELIVRELATGVYHPGDNKNNAKDDLSDIMQFIRQNMKDKYLKQYGDD